VVSSVPGLTSAGAPPQRGADEGEDQFKRRYEAWKSADDLNKSIVEAREKAKINVTTFIKTKNLTITEVNVQHDRRGFGFSTFDNGAVAEVEPADDPEEP
jgi:hypothetical protein